MASPYLIPAVIEVLEGISGFPKVFLDMVPTGQGLYSPVTDDMPAVVIEDLGEISQVNASKQAGKPIAVRHAFALRAYSTETSSSAMKTREILAQIGGALTTGSISLTGQLGTVSLVRRPGSNSVRYAGEKSESGLMVFRGEMFYEARYRPPY